MKKNLKQEFEKLTKRDVYSTLLFILYQLGTIPKYKVLRDMLFVLDRKTFLKLCEFYGGKTVTFPTIEQLQSALDILKIYREVDIDGNTLKTSEYNQEELQDYMKLREILSKYNV